MFPAGAWMDRLFSLYGQVIGACVLAAVVTYVLSLAVARVSRRVGLLDQPEPRRVHRRPVPRLGGIAIFISFAAVSLLVYRPANDYESHVNAGLLSEVTLTYAIILFDAHWD